MGARGYYQPPGHENLAGCDGFYVDNSVLYQSGDIESDWAALTARFCESMTAACPDLRVVNAWKSRDLGQSRYVLLSNRYLDIMLETQDDYTAFYAIIPEDCDCVPMAKRVFRSYVNALRRVLTGLYPGHVRKRKNAWECLFVG